MSLLLKPNPSSGVPIYVQLKEQIRHAVEIGVLGPGEPLPPIRSLAEQLVVNANTIARVYRELDAEGAVRIVVVTDEPEKYEVPEIAGRMAELAKEAA